MNIKKIICAGLVCAMILSLSLPVFAADIENVSEAGTYDGTVEVSGEVKYPTIKVTIPDDGEVIVNPYKMEVQVGSDTVEDQIISATQYIVNESDVAISVNTTVTGAKVNEDSTVVFATKPNTASTTTKSVFMYFEIVPTTAADGTAAWGTAYDSKSTGQILVGAKSVTKEGMLVMDAKGGAKPAAAYRLTGDAAINSESPWTENDNVKVTLAFTFAPTVVESTTNGK